MSLLCSSLNWVTPQMLSIPFPDKKTEVTGDPFLPAITGDSAIHYLNAQCIIFDTRGLRRSLMMS